MAFNPTAVGRVRVGGSDTNGAWFDSAISGAGTDYSQQDAAQLALTDLATSGAASTTLTSATGGFTAAMIGNAIYIASGTNFTVGYYFITARPDTNTVTLDRTPTPGGAGSSGVGNVGGAAAGVRKLTDNSQAVGNKAAAGNTIYVRGSGSQDGAVDYSFGTFCNPTVGNTTDGYISIIGENGRPHIQTELASWVNLGYTRIIGIKFSASSSGGLAGFGIFNTTDSSVVKDCILDNNNRTEPCVKIGGGGCLIINNELRSTSPSGTSGEGIEETHGFGNLYAYNYIHDINGIGISLTSAVNANSVIGNIVVDCLGDGIKSVGPTTADRYNLIIGNTVDANAGHGINITASTAITQNNISNNIITNHTTSGKSGLIVAGTTATNDRLKSCVDFNNVWNNTADYTGISAGDNDVSLDPGYTDAAGGDYSVGTSMKAIGTPSAIGATPCFVDLGAAQREEAGGGGGNTIIIQRGSVQIGVRES